MSAMLGSAMRRMQPAQFVLDHRIELSLTPEQVPFLESLVLAEADSMRVRNVRRVAAAKSAARDTVLRRAASALAWTGPIDEDAIREMTRRQAEQSVEYQIDVARDRHAVGAVLTPSQVSLLRRLEAADMIAAGGGVGSVSVTLTPQPVLGQPYFDYQVEKQVAIQPGSPLPKYPEALRASDERGQVVAVFVVDAAGHYEAGSLKVQKSNHPLFTQALIDALPLMQFTAAEVGGAKVRQLVQRPFVFTPEMK